MSLSRQFDPQAAAAYGDLILAAYAMYNSDNDDLTPAPQLPPGWDFVAWIQMSDFFLFDEPPRFYGFIARAQSDATSLVIALRGTQSWLEWYDDFSIFRVPFTEKPDSGWVANGFARIYKTLKVRRGAKAGEAPTLPQARLRASRSSVELEGSFADQVEDAMRDRPPGVSAPELSIAVTGHSLGAALGTLYVIEHARRAKTGKMQLCTFASPRVGDADFVAEFNELDLTSWRIVNAPDLVPNLPPDFLGYGHVDALHLFDSRKLARWSVSCWHALDTYLALVDPGGHQLQPECALGPEHAQMLAAQ
jgi:hypothetical protein